MPKVFDGNRISGICGDWMPFCYRPLGCGGPINLDPDIHKEARESYSGWAWFGNRLDDTVITFSSAICLDSFTAEAMTTVKALQFAEELGFETIELEEDSNIVVKKLKLKMLDKSPMRMMEKMQLKNNFLAQQKIKILKAEL
ncbi:hypothetical protein Goarm_014074 [Gossypium armourianum]|uniref:RNase H type-1 domain-containing protein n=1 Tax=Gossypium armourianum TaxID=34283 RepID=A0A7J9J538_9ROSI|nr:hypothetical protein [Gossypium armourianum]